MQRAVVEFVGALRPRGHGHVVCDDDERGVGLAGDLLEECHDDAARVRVEGARRLVGEDDARAAHEGARDRDALLLATTHLARVGVRALT